jgi:hypothetical protein
MFKNDQFVIGSLLGLLLPALAYISVELLKFDVQILGKPHLLYIAAAGLNLVMMRVFYRQGKANTASGVIFSTFISAILFVILNR